MAGWLQCGDRSSANGNQPANPRHSDTSEPFTGNAGNYNTANHDTCLIRLGKRSNDS